MLTAPRLIQDPARRNGYALAVALILLISTALRLWQLSTPAEMMFDEIYYAKDGKAIVDGRVGTEGQYRWAAGDEVSWPHPEMGKYAIAAGILVFGDRSFGWRIPAVVAGIALLACVYPLGRRLGLSPPWALLALLFAAADPLGIAQSRIATLDIFIAVWTVVSILCVLKYVQDGWGVRWLFLAGLSGGMAAATKWSGGLAIIAAALIIAVSWLLQRRAARRTEAAARADEAGQAAANGAEPARRRVPLTPPLAEQRPAQAPTGSAWRRIGLVVVALVVVPVGIYMLSYRSTSSPGIPGPTSWSCTGRPCTSTSPCARHTPMRPSRRAGSSTIARSGTSSRAPRRTTASSPSGTRSCGGRRRSACCWRCCSQRCDGPTPCCLRRPSS